MSQLVKIQSHEELEENRIQELGDVTTSDDNPLGEVTAGVEEETSDSERTAELETSTTTGTIDYSRTPSESGDERDTPNMMNQLRCHKPCFCSCHLSRTEFQIHPWLSFLTGWGTLGYNLEPTLRKPQCSEPSCKRNGSLRMTVNYRFPEWLWKGALAFRASYDDFTGVQCSSSLRPARVLRDTDRIWANVIRGTVYEALQNSPIYFPGDENEVGIGLIGVSRIALDVKRCSTN